jgi:glucosylceramidase
MRGRLERLAILPLRLDPDEALSGERCERLLLLEYFFATGRVSRGGWAQNSLVSVDTAAKTFKYNYEYYLMKHLSRFVKPGAKRLDIFSLTGYENLLVFANPDESVVIMMQNDLCQEMPVRVKVGDKVIASTLEADSFNTFVVYYRA